MAQAILSGSFTGTGNSAAVPIFGRFNLTISGTFVGTVVLERSDDGGTTWIAVARDTNGNQATFNSVFAGLPVEEDEPGMQYRVRCSAYTSGTINYRIGLGTVVVPGQHSA